MPADAHALARSVARLSRRLRQERRSDLTPTQLSVLHSIAVLGSATPREVAARERVSPPSLTRTLATLVERGCVDRRPHPEDGRQQLLSLSATGAAALVAERERRDAWLHQRLQDLTDAERATLRDAAALLERLADAE